MTVFRAFSFVLLFTAALFLSACDNAEDRAQEHFETGMKWLEAGEIDRALVEFRNVFNLNGRHREARLAYAKVQRDRGEAREAYGQYLRLVEQYPDDLEGLRALSEMAFARSDWEELGRHARAARDLVPEDPQIIAFNAVLDFREARLADDRPGMDRAAATARTVMASPEAAPVARRVVIEGLVSTAAWPEALAELNAALAVEPANPELHEMKLRLLAIQGETQAIGAHLQEMVQIFPETNSIQSALVAWYVETGDLDGAEAFLRSLTEHEDPVRVAGARIAVVRFLYAARGAEAARAELDQLIAEGGDTAVYRNLRAGINFETGDRAVAIAELKDLLDGAAVGEQNQNTKIALARMLLADGDLAESRTLAEAVLAEDPGHVEALQMKAGWLIREDRPDEAISVLRTALQQAPRNPETLTLMAEAHLRDGSRELAGERLALAVEVSDEGAEESLRYARFLIENANYETAEGILVAGLRRAPGNVSLLAMLGELQGRMEKWSQVEGVISVLRAIGTDQATGIANGLQVSLLSGQQQTEEGVAQLEQFIARNELPLEAAAVVVRYYLAEGRTDEAGEYLDSLIAETPSNRNLRLNRANLHTALGEVPAAEAIYRSLIAEDPSEVAPTQALYSLLRETGRADEAEDVVDAGIEASGRASALLVLRANTLIAADETAAALALYEEVYARDTANLVIANNLASLLSVTDDGPESLERAFAIGRRFRNSDIPEFRDTYGWIEYRRGNYDEALRQLEPAAAARPDNPVLHLHLGLTYAALELPDAARSALARALDMAEGLSPSQQADARGALEALPGGE